MTQKIWDAVVIGSGATGGVAAHFLSARGLRVLVLEAGPDVGAQKDYGSLVRNVSHQLHRHYVSKRQEIQKSHATYWTTNPDFFVDDVDNPYTTPPDKPFRWIRGRQVGGRTLTWDGVTPRLSDFEFKAADRDGFGPNWPICHDDLAPYYSELERMFGVHGSKNGLEQLPDGDFKLARPLTSAERVFKRRVESQFPGRVVLPSRGIRAGRRPTDRNAHTRLSSQATSLHTALGTGRVTVRSNALVSRVSFGSSGDAARGVEFIDTQTRQTEEVLARVVFVCSSTIETIRLLLNSEDAAHPGGLGASSGVLGRYVMDHLASNSYFCLPDVPDFGGTQDLLGSDSILIPHYQNLNGKQESYLRGFGFWGGIQRLGIPQVLRKRKNVAFGFLCARSEALPHFDNVVTLDPEKKDAWGIPVPHISCEWKKDDLEIAAAARRDCAEMIEAAGGEIVDLSQLVHMPIVGGFIRKMQTEWLRSTPGLFVHEVGGARMGTRSDNSVVNAHNQVWEAPNVYVVDGACWPSCGWQNPTLTHMAITARAAHHAAESLAGR